MKNRKFIPLVALVAAAATGCGSTVSLGSAVGTSEASADGLGLGTGAVPTASSDHSLGDAPVLPEVGPTASANETSSAPQLPDAVSSLPQTSGLVGKPLRIGVLIQKEGSDAAGALGGSEGEHISPRNAWLVAIATATAGTKGAIAGRPVVTDFYQFNPTASDYASEMQAACSHFVSDKRADIVLQQEFYNETLNACLTKAKIPQISASPTAGDLTAAARDIGRFDPNTMTIDTREKAVINTSADLGLLKKGTKLGLFIEECPATTRAYARTVKPMLAALGVEVSTQSVDCTAGFGSASAAASAAASAVLRFRSAGVTVVRAISTYEAAALLLFANAANSQGFKPTYLISSIAGALVLQANLPASQYENFHGVGWIPQIDVAHPPVNSGGKGCLATAKARQQPPGGPTGEFILYGYCQAVATLKLALVASGGDASEQGVVRGFASLGELSGAAANLGGGIDFSHGSHYGVSTVRPFAWSTSCSCFAYLGSARKV